MIQNADKGLLAGLWDFPHVLTSHLPNIKEKIDIANENTLQYIRRITSRRDLGECQHLFTHIKRTMLVEVIECERKDTCKERWVTEDEMLKMAIPATLKKALNLLDSSKREKMPLHQAKKRKTSADPKQPSIIKYFQKI